MDIFLKLLEEVELSENVTVIGLPSLGHKIDSEATAFGWGIEKICSNDKNKNVPDILKMVTLIILEETACNEHYNTTAIVNDSHFCTIGKKKGENLNFVSKIRLLELNKFLR